MDGLTVQLASAAVLVDGTTLTPGGPGISMNGKRISLEQDGTLDIGTARFALPPGAVRGTPPPPPPDTSNLNGVTVQARRSAAVVVNGATLSPNGPGRTINRSSVSLESGGTLDVGTARFVIPTGSVEGTMTSSFEASEGGQDKARRMACWTYVYVAAAMTVVGLRMVGGGRGL